MHQELLDEPGLLKQVLKTDEAGQVVRLAGVMGGLARGGPVAAGDPIRAELAAEPHCGLAPV